MSSFLLLAASDADEACARHTWTGAARRKKELVTDEVVENVTEC